jgi:EAL domain-containing protein (putative c-di-GMP-specific phosphodiesterase class I)
VGHALGIQTIAEWVENRQTLEVLKELGVDYAQGYWLCRPQPLVHDVE